MLFTLNPVLQLRAMSPPRASSPLRMVEEETGYAPSVVGSDLWEAASLDYPGRDEDLYPMEEEEEVS